MSETRRWFDLKKHRLKLGDIVPAGGIFDVIPEGTDAVSEVKRDFEKAKRLYEQKLRPVPKVSGSALWCGSDQAMSK